MMKWVKKEAGRYEDATGRFVISKTWDRSFGNHWELRDKMSERKILEELGEDTSYNHWFARRKATQIFNTFAECKAAAERTDK